ncbi:MAG: tRNA pseudouridine(55) synthase TruB [Clostridiales bacterium]|nr:tRNA pseudouridine(55) synthase TruB [Clostridiales bacterium]
MINGIININKEKGYTSHDVVAKMRGILKIKKIGHTGTLDPDAEGVLPICIGKATKLVELITDKDKTYEAVLKLGITTDTQDITGKILSTREVHVSEAEIREAINSFIGEYMQLPPMYSAIKVNGKKLYELAREGIEIERKRRKVRIDAIRILQMNEKDHEITLSVDCGKGTYIRTLLHDIGEKLACGGTMKSLTRTAVGSFKIENAYKLAEIEQIVQENRIDTVILPMDQVLGTYPKITVTPKYHKLIYNGNSFRKEHTSHPAKEPELGWVRVYDSNHLFIGIYQYDIEKECYKPVKMFL